MANSEGRGKLETRRGGVQEISIKKKEGRFQIVLWLATVPVANRLPFVPKIRAK